MLITQCSPQKSLLDKLYINSYIASFIFIFAGLFLIPKGHEVIEALVTISAVLGIACLIKNKYQLSANEKLWIFILVFYGLVIIFSHFIHGDRYRYGKSLLIMALFVTLRPEIKNIEQIISYSAAIGGILLGALSLYQLSTGIMRVEGFINAIPFSHALMTVLLFNFYFLKRKSGWQKALIVISIISLLASLYLAQTRGVWIALLALGAVFFTYKLIRKPLKYTIITAAIIMFAFMSYDNSGFIKQKISAGISDLEKASTGNMHSSWGLRLVAWESAALAIKDNPLLGIGRDNFHAVKEQQVKDGQVDELALHKALAHTHNQYLHSQLIRGILGTASLLLLLAYPFIKSGLLNKHHLLFKSLAISYAIFSLSDVPFEHLSVIYLYVLSMSLIYYFESSNRKSESKQ